MSELRTATAEDAAAIARVHVASWQAAYRGLLPDNFLDSLSVESRQEGWARSLSTGPRVIVYVRDREIAGFVTQGRSRDEDTAEAVGELYAIYVHPTMWGTGAGHGLHDAAVAALVEEGFTEATLWLLAGNTRARDFYERHDWRTDGTSKADQLAGIDVTEVRYKRSLT